VVEVYAMAVERVQDRWAEDFRDRVWVDPEEAARRVREPVLKRMIQGFFAKT
jgi:hypothetical protein